MKQVDHISEIIKCCRKREEILIKEQSMRRYNFYFDKMRKSARKLINENRQKELLPYLEDNSVSIQRDIAGLLINCFPEICHDVLEVIAYKSDIPIHFGIIKLSARDALKYGVPKEFP